MSEKEILYIAGSLKDEFQKINDKNSPLKELDNKHVFLMCMVLGYKNESRSELGANKWNVTRTSYLDKKEESLIKAVAIATENNLNVLLDKKKVFSIAEEYASGGVKYLKEKVYGDYFGSFNKVIESELTEEVGSIERESEKGKKGKNPPSRT